MQLQDWLQLNGISPTEFAKAACVSRQLVYSWFEGKISATGLARVQALTDGEVLPLDFVPEQRLVVGPLTLNAERN